MKNSRKISSIKNLMNLYIVVMGVALSLAVRGLIGINQGLESVTFPSILLFVGFIATFFPFFHGALRHLDDTYIENNKQPIKTSMVIVDFFLLFIHALAFVILSLLLKTPEHFLWILICLLSIDFAWGIFIYIAAYSKKKITAGPNAKLTAESKWTIINIIFVVITAGYLVSHNIALNEMALSLKFSGLIASLCIVRSIIDYSWCINFYFPPD